MGKWSSPKKTQLTHMLHDCSHTYHRTSIAIRGKDGVVLGVEKLISSKLHETKSNKRIYTVDHHIGLVGVCDDDTQSNT